MQKINHEQNLNVLSKDRISSCVTLSHTGA